MPSDQDREEREKQATDVNPATNAEEVDGKDDDPVFADVPSDAAEVDDGPIIADTTDEDKGDGNEEAQSDKPAS